MTNNKTPILKPGEAKLLDKAIEIRLQSVLERNQIGFAARILVQCNLPHSDPGNDVPAWIRRNGKSSLTIQPKWLPTKKGMVCLGYPYGNIPRLILFYLCTQAVQTKQRVIPLGNTLSEFMHQIGLEVTGGKNGTIDRFKDQLWRLLSSNIALIYQEQDEEGDEESLKLVALQNTTIVDKIQLWWDIKSPEQGSLFNSYIELTDQFVNEIWSFPVPIDLGIISAIKQSSLALDFYAWLTHRVTYLEKPTRVSWVSLANQIGSDYANIKDFKRKSKIALQKIAIAWPSLNIQFVDGGLELRPSLPSVPLKIT